MTVSLTLRNTKGSALTFTEMDTNLQNLANAASTADTFFGGNLTTQGFVQISSDAVALTGNQVLFSTNAFDSSVSGYSSAAGGDAAITSGGLSFMVGGGPQANYPARTLNSVFVPDIATAYQSNASVLGVSMAQQAGWGNVYLGVTNSTTGGFYQFSNVGLKFVDNTVQSTAALPLTGGSVTGNIALNNNYLRTAILETTTEKTANIGAITGTVTINANTGPIQTATLVGNVTINTTNLSNFNTGESVTLVLTQDGTGSRALTSNLKYAGASKTLSTAAGSIDTISITYDGTNYLASLVKGYA